MINLTERNRESVFPLFCSNLGKVESVFHEADLRRLTSNKLSPARLAFNRSELIFDTSLKKYFITMCYVNDYLDDYFVTEK